MSLPIGIEVTLETDDVLNIVTDRQLRIRLNGRLLNAGPASAQQAPKPLFWNSDGTQSAEGTQDLRGEVR